MFMLNQCSTYENIWKHPQAVNISVDLPVDTQSLIQMHTESCIIKEAVHRCHTVMICSDWVNPIYFTYDATRWNRVHVDMYAHVLAYPGWYGSMSCFSLFSTKSCKPMTTQY